MKEKTIVEKLITILYEDARILVAPVNAKELCEISRLEALGLEDELNKKLIQFRSKHHLSDTEWENGKRDEPDYEEIGQDECSPPEILSIKGFKTEQITTWIGESLTTEGKTPEEINGGHGMLLVTHQCGNDKEALISQLKTMINGLEDGFKLFAGN